MTLTTHEWIAVGVLLVLLYAKHHHSHYRRHRRHRRAGCGFWYSMRGPFGGRVTYSKHF
jgi:hypothetical protein